MHGLAVPLTIEIDGKTFSSEFVLLPFTGVDNIENNKKVEERQKRTK
jgi:hypothetical protein